MKALLLAIALVLFVGITARAADDNVIHGCIKARNQVLRIAATCGATERPISWNEQGPAGPPGEGGGTAPAFEMVTGSARSDEPGAEEVSCPEGKVVLAASVWTEDDWNVMIYNLPVKLSDDGAFQRTIVADWSLWYEEGTSAYWNVTCGTVG